MQRRKREMGMHRVYRPISRGRIEVHLSGEGGDQHHQQRVRVVHSPHEQSSCNRIKQLFPMTSERPNPHHPLIPLKRKALLLPTLLLFLRARSEGSNSHNFIFFPHSHPIDESFRSAFNLRFSSFASAV